MQCGNAKPIGKHFRGKSFLALFARLINLKKIMDAEAAATAAVEECQPEAMLFVFDLKRFQSSYTFISYMGWLLLLPS